MTNNPCCLCNKELGDALPVKYWGKDAHMRCVDNKRIEFMKEVEKEKEEWVRKNG